MVHGVSSNYVDMSKNDAGHESMSVRSPLSNGPQIKLNTEANEVRKACQSKQVVILKPAEYHHTISRLQAQWLQCYEFHA